MRSKRLIWFFIMITLGLAGGLAYGWVINPVKYVNTSPSTLRSDYKADYVLMTAEIYHSDHDLNGATQRLSLLGSQGAVQTVNEAIINAQKIGYLKGDLEMMISLSQALQSPTPAATAKAQP
jgi:hypothetical protein